MKKTIIIIGAIFILLLCVGTGGYVYWTGTPIYALKQAMDSFKSKNKVQFENYVDIDSVIDSMVDDILSSTFQDISAQSKSGWNIMHAAFGVKLVETFKPQIRTMVKGKIFAVFDEESENKKSIEKAISGRAMKLKGVEDLLTITKNMKIEFLGLGDINESDNIAIIPIHLKHKIYKKKFSLEIKLSKIEGSWRITQVRKVDEIMTKVNKWKATYLNELNTPIIEKMNKAIKVSGLKKQNRSGQWGYNRRSIITIGLRNISNKKINKYAGKINIVNVSGDSVRSFPLDIKTPLAPGKIFNGQVVTDINQFIKNDVRLYKTPQENMKAQLEIEHISFSDGSELKLYRDVPDRASSSVE